MKRAYRPFLAFVAVFAFSANVHAQRTVTLCEGDGCLEDTLEVVFEDGSSLYAGAMDVGTEISTSAATDTKTEMIQGWSYGVKHDTAVLSIVEDSVTTAGTIAHADSDPTAVIPPGFDATSVVEGGYISAVVLSFLAETQLPVGEKHRICNAKYTIDAAIPAEGTFIEPVSGELGPAGSPPTDVNFTVGGAARLPTFLVAGQIGGGGGGDEICDDGEDNDGDGDVDCDDADCVDDAACVVEICDDEIDNDGDGDIDCADADCADDAVACPPVEDEICDDEIDNDGDGDIDCDDADCDGNVACPVGECPDWALYFGDAAAGGDVDASGAATLSVSLRNASDALAFSVGIAGSRNLEFSSALGADANRLVELIITDDNGDSQVPQTPNTATIDADISDVSRGAALTGNDPGDFFAFDLTPGVGGDGLTVGYVSDLDGDENKIPASAGDCSSLNEILVLSLGGDVQRPFQRGDADDNGKVNVSDAVWIIQVVLGNFQARLDCNDALDADNDGSVTIGDALPVLAWVFQRGDRLADPFLACGTDTGDSAGCNQSSSACQ